MTETYPRLALLAGAYFHQDYDLDGTPDDVVRLFRTLEPPEAVADLVQELERLLPSVDDDEAARLWLQEYRANYNPTHGGGSCRVWLAHVRDLLTA